ncbi:Globin [Penicillium griseofulvum]|uniref:nitric oxide dioxygenase n=1 Tax=Penicillium patulum TaxID=5078 RepID=A0A135LI04_PENPA|nr:Globin [Penicillium griseofulvum]KXG48592.1 Globin [Penicillium griseofulvum]
MASNPGMTPDQIALIKATVPVLVEHGSTITTVFYRNMLAAHPELNTVFNTSNQVNGHQPRSLAGALYAYASHIDDLGALSSAVELICNKHASLYIKADDYKIVGKYLLEAMGEVLGAALTPEIHDAWGAAYWQLADIMIGREKQLYEQAEDWTDWRDFKIVNKVKESEEITSFYLAPVDEKPLPAFQPGQYISIQTHVPALKYPQARQYSLSDQPKPDYYRISVKREQGLNPASPDAATHPGCISNILHDTCNIGDVLKVSHPYGDFFLSTTDSETGNPIVLISAGVGLTPLTSMLNTLISKSAATRKLHFIHGARSSGARAFKEHISELPKQFPSIRATFFTSHPSEGEKEGEDFDHAGRVDLAKLKDEDLFLDDAKTDYYICGPGKFMTDIESGLKAKGVGADRIKMELFGTGGVPH